MRFITWAGFLPCVLDSSKPEINLKRIETAKLSESIVRILLQRGLYDQRAIIWHRIFGLICDEECSNRWCLGLCTMQQTIRSIHFHGKWRNRIMYVCITKLLRESIGLYASSIGTGPIYWLAHWLPEGALDSRVVIGTGPFVAATTTQRLYADDPNMAVLHSPRSTIQRGPL